MFSLIVSVLMFLTELRHVVDSYESVLCLVKNKQVFAIHSYATVSIGVHLVLNVSEKFT